MKSGTVPMTVISLNDENFFQGKSYHWRESCGICMMSQPWLLPEISF